MIIKFETPHPGNEKYGDWITLPRWPLRINWEWFWIGDTQRILEHYIK